MSQRVLPEVLDSILEKNEYKATNIISILQDTQDKFRHLPPEIFAYYGERLGISEARIYSVATFYENFSLEPKGKYVIKICDGTACHVRKSIPILTFLRDELGLSEDRATSDDLMFTIETVSCLGACGLAPVIMINEQVHGAMTPDKAGQLLNELREEAVNA